MVACHAGLGVKLQWFSFPAIHLPLANFLQDLFVSVPFLTAR